MSSAEGFDLYEIAPVLFYNCSIMVMIKLGESVVWQMFFTEQFVMYCVEWLRQVYDRCRLCWLPPLVEAEIARLDDSALTPAFGNARNVADFCELMKRRYDIRNTRYEGDWANVPH